MSRSKWYPNDTQNSPQGEDEIPKKVALFDLAERGLLESALWWMFFDLFWVQETLWGRCCSPASLCIRMWKCRPHPIKFWLVFMAFSPCKTYFDPLWSYLESFGFWDKIPCIAKICLNLVLVHISFESASFLLHNYLLEQRLTSKWIKKIITLITDWDVSKLMGALKWEHKDDSKTFITLNWVSNCT